MAKDRRLFILHKGIRTPLSKNYKMSSMLRFFKEVDEIPKIVVKRKRKEMIF